MSIWLSKVFDYPTLLGAFAIFGKTVVVYIFLVLGLRLLGKRQLGQMNIYDLVLIIVLANAVQNAMVGNDNTLVGGVIAASTLLLMNRLFSILIHRSSSLEHKMVGDPLIIVQDGQMLVNSMKKEAITPEQLYAAMREHGITELSDVQLAVLEVDGGISIVPDDSTMHRSHRHFKGLRLT